MQTSRQADKQTGRQTNRQTNRQADKHKQTEGKIPQRSDIFIFILIYLTDRGSRQAAGWQASNQIDKQARRQAGWSIFYYTDVINCSFISQCL